MNTILKEHFSFKVSHLIYWLLLISSFVVVQAQEINEITINSIRFVDSANKEINNEKFPFVISLKEGMKVSLEEFSSEYLIKDVQELKKAFPRYVEITTQMIPLKDDKTKIDLTFEMLAQKRVGMVRLILPDDAPTDEDLKKKLKTKKSSVLLGKNISIDEATLLSHFQSLHYPKTTVTHEIRIIEEDTIPIVEVKFVVKFNGGKALFDDWIFKGNEFHSKSRLIGQMESRDSAFLRTRYVDLSLLNSDMESVVKYYKDSGFMDAKASYRPIFKEDDEVDIEVTIVEGPRYTVNHVEVNGVNKEEKSEFMSQMITLKEKGYSGRKIRKDLQTIRKHFGSKGYIRAEVKTEYDSNTGKLEYLINKGKVYYIDQVVIKGKNPQQNVLRKITLVEGQKVDSREIEKTIRNLKKTGWFRSVYVDFIPRGGSNQGDLIVVLQEAKTHSFHIVTGVSADGDNFGGSVSYSNRNLFWTGKQLTVSAYKSLERTRIAVTYKDPHLMGTDYELYVGGRFSQVGFRDFDKQSLGANIAVKKLITDHLKLGLGVRVDFVKIDDVSSALQEEVHSARGRDKIVGLVGTVVYNKEKLNDLGDSVGGYKIRMALYPSYSDDEGFYSRQNAEIIAHKTIYENKYGDAHVLTGRLTVGAATSTTPFYEKFYGGGVGSIRGFRARSLTGNNQAKGTKFMATGGLSYSAPIFYPELRMVLFVEAASLGDDLDAMGEVRVSSGAGIRANLTNTFLGTTIEAGVAVPVLKQDGDEKQLFYLLLGNYDPEYDL